MENNPSNQPERGESSTEKYADIDGRLFKQIHSPGPDDYSKYYIKRRQLIEAGRPTWMVRTFQADSGRVYDFYEESRLVGFIDEDYSAGIAAFVFDGEDYRVITEGDTSLGRAIFLVEKHGRIDGG